MEVRFYWLGEQVSPGSHSLCERSTSVTILGDTYWRLPLAVGLLAAGASALGLFDDPGDAAPLIAWIYVVTGALVIGASAIKLRTLR
jgi:hypothetical protein